MLSPLLAHGRQFPSEEGAYVRLQEPIIVGGTICRADWVDGATTRCRDTLHGGEKRKEDWQASTCAVCKHFEASPCGDIFRRCPRPYVLVLDNSSVRPVLVWSFCTDILAVGNHRYLCSRGLFSVIGMIYIQT